MTDARTQSTHAQLKAAHPEASVFVEANAGSGKTRVLVTRVIRLLLAGAALQRIVCLTFTRAAAAEMAKRLFDTLAAWTPLDDAALRDRVSEDCGVTLDAAGLVQARRLFARAIETPGGLKVQTIHSFCESILQRFPVEAGVPPGFRIMEEADSQALLTNCLDAIIDRAVSGVDPPLQAAFDLIVPHLGEESLRERIGELIAREPQTPLRSGGSGGAGERYRIDGVLGSKSADPPLWAIDEASYRAAADALRRSGVKTNESRAVVIDAMLAAGTVDARRRALYELYFDSKDNPRNPKSIVAGQKTMDPAILEFLLAELERIPSLEDHARAHELGMLTAALLKVSDAVAALYRDQKMRRGLFDFADLITITQSLLDSGRAAFVLYRLDGGLDHILIDEAQDTSPAQWSIVERLCEEFFAGEGARSGAMRSVFAVGDPKQSIFSFQGADPECFATYRGLFAERVRNAGRPFEAVPLLVSWRSSPLILKCVDRVLAQPGMAPRVATGSELRPHEAVEGARAGIVEVWIPPEAPDQTERDPWRPPPPGGRLLSAEREEALRIARAIRKWIDTGERVAPGGPPIRYGGILILVRRRLRLMDEIVRALRAHDIPVAGADRLKLLQHIAVQDLLAAARTALLPQDELSLAEMLKGPLFGFDDDDLMRLCLRRGKATLWDRLREAAGDPRCAEAVRRIEIMIADAASCGPYGFFAGLLAGDGRRRMIERLGPDAGEPLDELLTLALQQETVRAQSLAHFMGWIEAAEPEIKRDMESADQVRVMTVHGAKGLEADVVIVADTATPPDKTSKILWSGKTPVWCVSKRFDCAALSGLRQQALESALAEYQRLLYVALTRARYRLVVTASAAAKEGSWYATVAAALDDVLEPVCDENGLVVARRWVEGIEAGEDQPPPAAPRPAQSLPPWASSPARHESRQRLTPSSFGGEQDDDSAGLGGGQSGRKRGRYIHLLLEALAGYPAADRQGAGAQWLDRAGVPAEEAQSILAECLAVLDDPRLAALFGPGSVAEAAIAGRLWRGGKEYSVSGRIDRLAVDGDTVWLVDFKSDAFPPAPGTPPPGGYAAQLALYRRLLAEIYPGKQVRAALVWTAARRLDELDSEDLDRVLDAAREGEA
jgi:ATP-dependent helicase/nuclease subunit A